MSVTIIDLATPALARIRGAVTNRRGLMAQAGGAVNKELRGHFLRKNAQGNRRGWWRSNFWSTTVRKATSVTNVTEALATVTVASAEFAHKLKGGTITPKRGKFLALPTTSEAKQAGSPRDMADLFVIARKGGKGLFLARRENGAIRVQFRLLAKVTHKPDPTALPPDGTLESVIDAAAQKYLDREIVRASSGGTA